MDLVDYIKNNKPFCHFSVDDVFRVFTDKKQGYDFLKSLYGDYGVITTLYLFSQPHGKQYFSNVENGTMKDVSWLRFGPHAPEWEKPFNTMTVGEQISEIDNFYEQIKRIAGKESFADNIRLHSFKGSKEIVLYLKKYGVKSMFTQNYWDNRVSYHLPPSSREQLNNQGYYFDSETNMNFVKTQIGIEFRDEFEDDIKYYLEKHNFIVFYTHEEHLTDKKIQNRIRRVLDICKEKNIPFVY
jgi:hypothetical protein